jgi:hypothetical protein
MRYSYTRSATRSSTHTLRAYLILDRKLTHTYACLRYASVCATRRTAYSYTRSATRAAYYLSPQADAYVRVS